MQKKMSISKSLLFSLKDLVDDNAVITDSEDDDSMDVEEESAAVECEMREDELDAQVRTLRSRYRRSRSDKR